MSAKGLINEAKISAGHSGARSSTEWKVDQMTVDQMLLAAQDASRALNNQGVEVALQLRMRQLQNEWAETTPEEKNKREGLYQELRGTMRLLGSFQQVVASGQNLQNQQEQMQRRDQHEFQENQY